MDFHEKINVPFIVLSRMFVESQIFSYLLSILSLHSYEKPKRCVLSTTDTRETRERRIVPKSLLSKGMILSALVNSSCLFLIFSKTLSLLSYGKSPYTTPHPFFPPWFYTAVPSTISIYTCTMYKPRVFPVMFPWNIFAFVLRNLLDNPIDCKDAILKQLAASITLKSNCGQISNVAVESDLHFPHSEGKLSSNKRSVSSTLRREKEGAPCLLVWLICFSLKFIIALFLHVCILIDAERFFIILVF